MIRLLGTNKGVTACRDKELARTQTVTMKIDTGEHPPLKLRHYASLTLTNWRRDRHGMMTMEEEYVLDEEAIGDYPNDEELLVLKEAVEKENLTGEKPSGLWS